MAETHWDAAPESAISRIIRWWDRVLAWSLVLALTNGFAIPAEVIAWFSWTSWVSVALSFGVAFLGTVVITTRDRASVRSSV